MTDFCNIFVLTEKCVCEWGGGGEPSTEEGDLIYLHWWQAVIMKDQMTIMSYSNVVIVYKYCIHVYVCM